MKIVKEAVADKLRYAETSSVLEYSAALDERNLDFCINQISGRYPTDGYCSNQECEELCYVLEGSGIICQAENGPISFQQGDVIFIHKRDIYYWEGDFKIAIICSPAWSKDQCKLYSAELLELNPHNM